jgi:hypothetical protein
MHDIGDYVRANYGYHEGLYKIVQPSGYWKSQSRPKPPFAFFASVLGNTIANIDKTDN